MFESSPFNNLSPKPKLRYGVTKSAVSYHLISYRESASFVWIMFTKNKEKPGPELLVKIICTNEADFC